MSIIHIGNTLQDILHIMSAKVLICSSHKITKRSTSYYTKLQTTAPLLTAPWSNSITQKSHYTANLLKVQEVYLMHNFKVWNSKIARTEELQVKFIKKIYIIYICDRVTIPVDTRQLLECSLCKSDISAKGLPKNCNIIKISYRIKQNKIHQMTLVMINHFLSRFNF